MKVKNLSFLFALVLGIGLFGNVLAQDKPTVNEVKLVGNQTSTVQGSLSDGIKLKSLAWAWNSSNACFPEREVSLRFGSSRREKRHKTRRAITKYADSGGAGSSRQSERAEIVRRDFRRAFNERNKGFHA